MPSSQKIKQISYISEALRTKREVSFELVCERLNHVHLQSEQETQKQLLETVSSLQLLTILF